MKLAVSVATATLLTAVLPAFAPDALPWVVMCLILVLLGRWVHRRSSERLDRPVDPASFMPSFAARDVDDASGAPPRKLTATPRRS